MRQFSILLVFVVAFGGAAVLYEQESRKVKGVLSQITDLQAKVGDMQAEINRLNAELESVKMAERRRPNLNNIAARVLNKDLAQSASAVSVSGRLQDSAQAGNSRGLVAGDVTASGPAIRSHGEPADESEWSRPTVDAEMRELQTADEVEAVADPYR